MCNKMSPHSATGMSSAPGALSQGGIVFSRKKTLYGLHLYVSHQDRQVSDLAQDLANKLGLKVRKAYVSPQTESTAAEGENHGETSPPTGEVCTIVSTYVLSCMFCTKH